MRGLATPRHDIAVAISTPPPARLSTCTARCDVRCLILVRPTSRSGGLSRRRSRERETGRAPWDQGLPEFSAVGEERRTRWPGKKLAWRRAGATQKSQPSGMHPTLRAPWHARPVLALVGFVFQRRVLVAQPRGCCGNVGGVGVSGAVRG